MSFSLAFSRLSPQRLCSSKDFEVLKVHKHKFMLFSFAIISVGYKLNCNRKLVTSLKMKQITLNSSIISGILNIGV